MQREYLEHLATLRAVVGFLGERDQSGWWPSSFFGAGSSAFVTPVFPRTHFLAQCLGVTGAALKVHDERIGVGRVFHLFRLPEDLEQGIHRVLHDDSCVANIREKLVDREAAMRFLNEGQLKGGGDIQGPVLVADTESLRTSAAWGRVAQVYSQGFAEGAAKFPYFADRK